MSYHRIEPYVWDDGKDMHLWSNIPTGDTGFTNAVTISLRTFDEIVVKRFLEIVREERVPDQLIRAVGKTGSKFHKEMFKSLRKVARVK